MEFSESNGAAFFMAEMDDSFKENIYKLDVVSGQLTKYTNLPIVILDNFDFSYSTNKIIVTHYDNSKGYLSLLNLTPEPPSLEGIYGYNVNEFSFGFNTFAGSEVSNPDVFFNLHYFLKYSDSLLVLILSRISLSHPSETQTKISKHTYATPEHTFYYLDFEFMNESLYFLFDLQ